jgi:hypothetical protein
MITYRGRQDLECASRCSQTVTSHCRRIAHLGNAFMSADRLQHRPKSRVGPDDLDGHRRSASPSVLVRGRPQGFDDLYVLDDVGSPAMRF